jgi:hypothetical protein
MSSGRRRLAALLSIGALSFLAPSMAWASVIPIGGGGTPPPQSSAPPSGGTVDQGESLPGAKVIADATADQGAVGEFVRSSADSGLAPGTYKMSARVKGYKPIRVDMLVGDQMAGSFGVSTAWTVITSVVTIGSDPRVGVGTWASSGTLPVVDVDWVQLAAAPRGLTVAGSTIVLPSGDAFRPMGFNKADYSDPHVKNGRLQVADNEATAIWAWGANMVRLSLNQEFWLADCAVWAGTTATTYRTAIQNEVRDLTAKGVYVMITLLQTDRGANTGCTVTNGVLREMADQRSVNFWQSVAGLYKSNDHVVFDLFNEPHDITAAVWRNGGTVTYGPNGGKSYTAVGMQTLYNTVRATGATNVVFVSGTGWASDPRVHLTNPLDGYGIVAGSHSYCHECAPDNPQPHYMRDTLNSPQVRARLPLTLTETGWPSPTSATFNRMMVDWADSNSIGWLVFSWLAPAGGQPDVYSIAGGATPDLDLGNGVVTRSPDIGGLPVWNELSDKRAARGLPAMPLAEPS